MEKVKYLIVGAGVSGLAFANWLKSKDYLILESDSEIGGYCKTITQEGFTWDYSGHFFHFKNREIEEYLVSRMHGQEIRNVIKSSKIYWGGEWIDFPFQKNIHQLPKEDFIECVYDLVFRPTQEPLNFKEMLVSKFGRGIAEKFLIPYNEKLYATDLKELDLDAMGRFFPFADFEQIIQNFRNPNNSSYNDKFTYPAGGAIQYVNALASEVESGKISLSEKLQSVDVLNKIASTDARKIAYDHIISSVPLPGLLDICSVTYDHDDFSWNKVLVFNLGFDRKGPSGIHWIYFPQSQLSFYRVGFYDNIIPSNRMSLYVEIGLDRLTNLSETDVEALRARVLRDLKKSGIVSDHKLVCWHSTIMDPAYVHITKKSIKKVSLVKRMLVNHGVHTIGRYGGWTYCSIEDNILEARDLAASFNDIEFNHER
ncbi:protoporphyrinogen/coproporphyrinogen oxidase [Marinobacter shengliensis]|uniref:protoporphyrinogen/coproporphyrinogen oxidase n=1 Tax=Marinobacter shengliensis TaxID=1389223 RepID=UPI001E5F0445|nr:FAD-dependent oxidoreductase [Marinobacter shengliensis]MCD1630755.1 FAD-dependent oxidoreductase [Marinobacter shengliensis]